MVFSNFQDILLKGYFGHFTCKDVNVIFEILEGNFVIFHKRGKIENIWNWKGIVVFSNFQVILLKGHFGHLTCRDANVIFEIF